MDTHDISRNELKELISEAIIGTLTDRRDLLEDAVAEAILDMKLGLAIEEGDCGVGYRKADKMRAKNDAKRSDEINQLIEYVNSRTSEALDAKKRGERFTSLQELQAAQQPVMNRIWDNPDDEVWNEL